MSETAEIKLNRLPAITWYWLGMNEAQMEAAIFDGAAAATEDIPAGVEAYTEAAEQTAAQPTGAGAAFSQLVRRELREAAVYHIGQDTAEALRLTYTYAEGDRKLNLVHLDAAPHSEATVVMDFASDASAAGQAGVQTIVTAGEGSVLRLVQIVRVGEAFTFVNDLGGSLAGGARVEIIHLVLSGKAVYQGYQMDLAGYKSYLQTDIAYRVGGDHTLDMNYFANHTGKKTECAIQVNGVLRDKAKKILRATIDLKRGACGAVGNEQEDVLLMDEGVHNQTIPLILCSEEDVVGNHGATIGRLDESLMFYLASRGMDKEEIYEMMAKARLDAVIRQIPDEKTRTEIETYVGGTEAAED